MSAVAILGPGGVGGFVAGALARAGEPVVVVAREATANRLRVGGLQVESVRLGNFHVSAAVVPILEQPTHLLLVATKATTLAPALERVQVQPRLVVPLLNGLEHMQLLRERFGPRHVAAGVIRVESYSPAPGRIVQSSPALRVDLAADERSLRDRLPSVAALLEGAGIPARLGDSEAYVMWSKLVRLVALATTTSASDQAIGFIRSDPEWRATLEVCIAEAAVVANAEGARIDPAAAVAELEAAHPELSSSMRRDLEAGREPELDAIAGAVLRAGRRHGIECPTITRLSTCIAERAGIPPPRA